MNVSLLIAVVSLTLQFSTTAAMSVIARAPGWQRVRWFALVAFSAGLYSVVDALAMTEVAHDTQWVPRLNILLATIHMAAWVAYTYSDSEGRWRSLSLWVRAVLLGGVAFVAAVSLLGVGLESQRVLLEVPSLGVQRPISRLSTIGRVAAIIPLAFLVFSAIGHVRRARRGEAGAVGVVIGFVLFTVCAVEEVLVAAGVVQFIFLGDLGYIFVTIPVTLQLLQRFTRDAARLDTLSTVLADEVERRTAERDEARVHLVEQQRLAALGRLAAGVGHEINNPLQYLRFSLEEIRDQLSPPLTMAAIPAPVQEAIEHAFDGVDRIRRVVDGLRTYARPADAMDVLEVNDLVETALRLGTPQWKHAITVAYQPGVVARVRGDEGKLVQVILNPLINAAQSMQYAGGSSGGGAAPLLQITTQMAMDGWVEILIRDSGPGFSPEVLGRLGEPYVTTKAIYGGTGLGLFVSRGMVEAHGGLLVFGNHPGGGAEVIIRLPSAAKARTGSTPAVPCAVLTKPARLPALRVLLVEDDPATLTALSRGLEGEGVTVFGVPDGRAALAWLASNTPDVVVTDLMMPVMSGVQFAARLAQQYPALRARLVVITGGAATAEAEDLLRDSSVLVLAKPIGRQDFAAQLRTRAAGLPASR